MYANLTMIWTELLKLYLLMTQLLIYYLNKIKWKTKKMTKEETKQKIEK